MKRHLLLVVALLMLLPACGRKGDLIVPGTVLPQAPSGLAAEPGGSGIILSFTRPDKNSKGGLLTDLAGFKVLRAVLPAGKEGCPCSFESVSYIDLEYPGDSVIADKRVVWLDPAAGLALGGKYVYKVVGVNADRYAGAESAIATARFQSPPAAPPSLAAKPGNKRVSLDWTPVEKDVTGGQLGDLAGYYVYRSQDPGKFPGVPVNAKPVKGMAYEDAGLANGTVYYYRVTALRGPDAPFTEGEPSAVAKATPADTEPPAPPAGLRAVPGERTVLMSWDPNVEDDLAGYYIYRKGPGEADFKRLNEKPADRITYQDTDVSSGSEYAYAVTAVDNAVLPNESKRSDVAAVKVP